MTEGQKVLVAMVVIFGLVAGGLWLSNSPPAGQETFHNVSRDGGVTATVQPASQVAPKPTITGDRYYQDRYGAPVSEKVAEESLEKIRNKVRSMPDNLDHAYWEGVLESMGKEWASAKRRGPVEPLRAVNTRTGEQVLIGEAPLPESQRRAAFYELVAAQDSGIGDAAAFILIEKKYGLAHATLLQIAYEGAAKKWPLP